jgi:predicted phage terminase large subunit-like protein
VPPEGNIVKRDWIRFYDVPPPSFDFTIASWDTASTISDTADYSVGTTWGAKGLDFYLLDVVRDRFEVPELRQRIFELARRRSIDQTVIEDTDIGRAIAQDLRRAGEYRAILHRPRFDKEARILAQSARFEAGQVHVPRDHRGPDWKPIRGPVLKPIDIAELARRLPEASGSRMMDVLTRMHVLRLLAQPLDGEDHTKDIDFTASGIKTR